MANRQILNQTEIMNPDILHYMDHSELKPPIQIIFIGPCTPEVIKQKLCVTTGFPSWQLVMLKISHTKSFKSLSNFQQQK